MELRLLSFLLNLIYNNVMKPKFIEYYSSIARETGNLSYCERAKVGAIIVKDNSIISIGYNGRLPGEPNICEITCDDGFLKTRQDVIHAEVNALSKLMKSTVSSDGSSMFITLSPCVSCSTFIIMAGIKEVFYMEEYRDSSGVELLRRHGVDVYGPEEIKYIIKNQ